MIYENSADNNEHTSHWNIDLLISQFGPGFKVNHLSSTAWHILNNNWLKIIVWLSRQTQNMCITLIQRRPNVLDVGTALYKCYANVLCLLE